MRQEALNYALHLETYVLSPELHDLAHALHKSLLQWLDHKLD